jgi:hypothetical protein
MNIACTPLKRWFKFLPGLFVLLLGMIHATQAQQILFVNDNDNITYNTDTLVNDLNHTTYSGIHYWSIPDSAGATPSSLYMSNFDLVIWYSSTDGVGLKFWTAGSAAGNAELVSYTAGGGRLWVIGQDLLYAKHTTGTTFNSGDFAYDFMGLSSYDVQSYADDGSIGCPQADRSPGASALFPASLKWIFPTLWYVDGCTPQSTTKEIYRMAPASYALNGRKCMFHNNTGGVNVMSTFFDPALIDTFVNRVDFMQKGITYLLGATEVTQSNLSAEDKIYPNPTTGQAFVNLYLPEPSVIQISITDIVGKVHYNAQQPRTTGQTTFLLPLQNLPSGMYVVQLRNENGHYLYKGKIQKL